MDADALADVGGAAPFWFWRSPREFRSHLLETATSTERFRQSLKRLWQQQQLRA